MSDTRPAGLGIGREYDFPEMRARFGTPAEPNPTVLPTIPGLYVAQDDTADHAATVYRLDGHGFWWHLESREATADEVAAHVGSHPLERLIRNSDADL